MNTTTRNTAWMIGLIALLSALWIGAGPYFAVADIKQGIVEKDSERLNDRVDFPILRRNLKDQLKVKILQNAANTLDDNPFGALATGLASSLVDGLAHLMEGQHPTGDAHAPPSVSSPPTDSKPNRELFENARYRYDSLSRFSVWVPNDVGQEVRFVLQRDGLSWKLVDVILPLDEAS